MANDPRKSRRLAIEPAIAELAEPLGLDDVRDLDASRAISAARSADALCRMAEALERIAAAAERQRPPPEAPDGQTDNAGPAS